MPGGLRDRRLQVHFRTAREQVYPIQLVRYVFIYLPSSWFTRPAAVPRACTTPGSLHRAFSYLLPLLRAAAALQSRTDTWQLANIAQIPCALNALECNATEWGQIQAYAPQFMDQWLSVAGSPDSHNGGFLDACLIHGSTESTIEGYTSAQAFASWLEGNTTHSNWWTMQCNSSSLTGPCDHGPTCGKFPGNATPTNP